MNDVVNLAIVAQQQARHQQKVSDAISAANGTFTTLLGQLEELTQLNPDYDTVVLEVYRHLTNQLYDTLVKEEKTNA